MAHSSAVETHDTAHDGHGGHHIFDSKTLIRTFVGLLVLTVLTVVTALMEREGWLPLGPFSVPVALAIAGAKAFLVASFFMNLWYEKGTNLLVFVGSIVFVLIFIGITFLDFAFRPTFDEQSAIPTDVIQEDILEAAAATDAIQDQFQAVPLVEQADPVLFGTEAPDPGVSPEATPAIDEAGEEIESPTGLDGDI